MVGARKSIPWWMPETGGDEIGYVKRALDDNFPNEGKLTAEFEDRLCKLTGARHAVVTTSATAAMFLSLKAKAEVLATT